MAGRVTADVAAIMPRAKSRRRALRARRFRFEVMVCSFEKRDAVRRLILAIYARRGKPLDSRCRGIRVELRQEGYMAESTLHQVQRLVEQLSPHEQARVLAFLALRMAQMVASTSYPAPVTPPETAETWEEFFRLGDALAASDTPAADTLTAAVLAMRR
jgi:hypothetical protein